MKCVLRKTDLESIVTKAARATDPKSPAVMIRNLFLEAKEGRFRAIGCDLYVSWDGSTEAIVEQEGAITAPAEDIVEKVSGLPDGSVSVELDASGRLLIKGAKRKHFLPTLPANDYPKLKTIDTASRVAELPIRSLKTALDRVYKAIDKKSDSHLAAVHMWIIGGELNIVVLNNHRYHWQKVPVGGAPDVDGSTMLSTKVVDDLRALLTGDGMVIATFSREWLVLQFAGGHTYRAKLLGWEYERPFWHTINQLKKEMRSPVKVPRALAIEAFSACGSEHGKLTLLFKPGRVLVESVDDDGSKSEDEIPIEYDGGERSFVLQQRYALELFQAAPDAFVDVEVLCLAEGLEFADAHPEDHRSACMTNGGIAIAMILQSSDFSGLVMGGT